MSLLVDRLTSLTAPPPPLRQLDPYFNNFDPDFSHLRTQIKEILQEEAELNEIVQLVGKDSLSEDQKLSLEIARIIREDFLQQNAFSDFDYMCPLDKTIGMMRSIVSYYEYARKAIVECSADNKINWNEVLFQTKPLFTQLTEMKFIVRKYTDDQPPSHTNHPPLPLRTQDKANRSSPSTSASTSRK